MHITRVELQDVKSYAQSSPICFAPGVNAISGPTGAGKSTILQAIGFALFNTPPCRPQSRFVREGARSGEIAISFVDALDEREYQVIRPVGGGIPYVYDPEIRRRIASGRGDVLDWLKEHLGVPPTAELDVLFTDAVGVPQGLLTAAFLETAGDRKHKFDPLLQVDDYELAWTRLRETASYLQEQVRAQQLHIAKLDTELRRLPTLQRESEGLQAKIEADQHRLMEMAARLDQVIAEKALLDTTRDRIQKLALQLEIVARRLEELGQQLSSAEADLRQAQEAQKIAEETEQGHHLFEKAQGSLHELEARRQERDQLREQLIQIERALALADQETTYLTQALEENAQAEARVTELEPLVGEQSQLEEQLKIAERGVDRLLQIQQRVTDERAKLDKLEAELQRVQEGLETLRVVEIEIDEKEQRRRGLEKQISAFQAEQGQIKVQRQQLRERLALLEQEEGAECPVCRRPLEIYQSKELNEHYQTEVRQLEQRTKEIALGFNEARVELRATEGRLAELRRQYRSLPHPSRETELTQEITVQQRAVKEWQEREASLVTAPDQVCALTGQLEGLGDPRSEHQRLQVEVDRRAGREAELAAAREKQTRHTEARERIAKALKDFTGLDSEIANHRATMTGTQSDHSRYLEHWRIAETLPQRHARVEQLQTERGRIEAQRKESEPALKEARSSYDGAKHQKLVEEHQQLNEVQTRLDERLKNGWEHLSKIRAEIEALQQLDAELEEVEQKREFLITLSEVLEFVRRTVREAGPYVTRALVKTISVEADHIFADILNDHTMRLRWEEDYGITVEHRGNDRDFSQLSGGEKMAAALSVRLALLREMSDIRIAFFDEPTAHLDDERRENLATQITQIKGFHQLFVISHDDTFERETHHIVRVSKENGISQVEVG